MQPDISLNDPVKIDCSDEYGIVIGVAHYSFGETQALVRYKAGDGRAVEQWWNFSALSPIK